LSRSSAPRAGIGLALFAAALWGLAPVATKGALEGYSPELINIVRLGLASLFCRLAGGPRTGFLPRDRWTVVAGVALGADFVLYNYGVRLTTAALAGLVINVEVVATIALAIWLLGERLTERRVLGSAVTLAGVAVVATARVDVSELVAPGRILGNLLVMLAGIAWSLFAVAQRRVGRTRTLFELLTPIFVVATLTTAPALLHRSAWENPGGAFATLMLLALTLLCTVGVYWVYARCQQLLDVSVLAIVLTLIPVFAVAFARSILAEPISARIVAGGAVILAGVLLIATEGRRLTIAVRSPVRG
jgi:drug/metabolite transporter (DMT)-like permease